MLENPQTGFRLRFHWEGLYKQGTSRSQRATFLTGHLGGGANIPPVPPLLGQERSGASRTKDGKEPFQGVPSLLPKPHWALPPKPASQFLLGSTPTQKEPDVRDRVLRHIRF